ncbi:MAG TPA: glycoside hydrolase family protein [Armatimonadota bacterium]|jgi:hypothetical protein
MTNVPTIPSFADRLLPAPVNGGFAMEDYWVWCGSAMRGEDGKYHLFASRWPRTYPFYQGYLLASEIVRAVADTPVGPYEFAEVVLPRRGESLWDGRMTHNPTIHRCGDTYLLYYIGSTFTGPIPSPEALLETPSILTESWLNIRTGLATAPSIFGPWTRRDMPILAPRADNWDRTMIANPAPCVRDDGRVLLIYRSSGLQPRLQLGIAHAAHFAGPYQRLVDTPICEHAREHVEDPYLWWAGDHYEMLAKDMDGGLTGEQHAGAHLYSADGLAWEVAPVPKGYSRTIRWDDGTTTTQGSLERPQLLIEHGQPTHLFLATADGPGGFAQATRTWNMVIPLSQV